MILQRIYSEPGGLFEIVEFNEGLNFIYGEKEINSPKSSLNSIGKSTFLDLIDFCLLSSFQKNHNPRLFSAFDILTGYDIVLEFKVLKTNYIIKRSVDEPNLITFGIQNEKLESYKIDELKKHLFHIIFRRKDYSGVQNSNWYRSLMAFYIKIQKFKKQGFIDPIKYISELTDVELNNYHFYLLGFDNSIPHKLHKYRTDEKGLHTSLVEIKKYISERYSLEDIKETQKEINRLKVDIIKLENAISVFKLGEHYEDAEEKANKLTESIKSHIYENFLDKEKIKSYEESYKIDDKLNLRRVSTMYGEISENLSHNIKKTLKDALDFRKELSKSRKQFIENEILKLKSHVQLREESINSLEIERAKLFMFLSTKEAIKDLTEAFFIVSEKKNKLSELESNTKILFDLTKELNDIQNEINKLNNEYLDLLVKIDDKIITFFEIFSEVYDAIYIDNQETSQFSITPNNKKKGLIELSISMPDMFGKGKNQGRTLVYDLAITILNIKETLNFPRFLIHDGIFDGVDKAHFISVCELIEDYNQKNIPIQYITTINEEGTLSADKFGTEELVDPHYIEEKTILKLSPNNKLFKRDF
ncbi:DUF2326 domain-containing protein [Elizabethkingia meningoseptica]|uniref:DUF2326 domain-containing protein n=1 Tax=Elizabethkingia meningoseptica TaxID=238 RepID=UPI0021A7A667|nr:DUF2326 domain-containing protein [Elizabethkingia meningoseptica]MCT3672559.1 DUF2326 domain-containing protein [Elizabethkingia anophelis]MCT3680359.1 DUF2326 domain-containing protein [Elizabethkingia anophelis]MDE5515941.1 DUF2326 domain-containing protein [Elizabethkingia meningoseptica]